MATVYEMNASAEYLADNGIGADHDGYFGSQCVDLINYLLYKHFGVELGGNAIDLLDAAANAGLNVVYDAPGLAPQAGAFFVMVTLVMYTKIQTDTLSRLSNKMLTVMLTT